MFPYLFPLASPFTSLGSLKKLDLCPQICKLGALIYYKFSQVFTAFTEAVTSLLGGSDCQSPLYTNICVPQHEWEDSWTLRSTSHLSFH